MATTHLPLAAVTLEDKWTATRGRALLSAPQAIARLLIAQCARDRAAGLRTAGYITGYRGSPLGHVDTALWAAASHLAAADVTFVPGVNEDLAATAVRGTQQLNFVPNPRVEGVFAAWYGKGPGVDRSLDALKHGNYGGTHPKGGVLIVYGDDHGGKSSTVAHHSEQSMAAAAIPSLYPSDVGEILQFGLLGYAMSRYSGSWVGLKLVNEVAEQTATVDFGIEDFAPVLPPVVDLPPEGVHVRANSFLPLREEQIVREHRLPLVQRFVRANPIDRTQFRAAAPALALVAAGKSFTDTRQALVLLGLDDARAAALGISLYKVGCIWPLEPQGIAAFARGHRTLLVVEEKASILEPQIAQLLVNLTERPRLIGKQDEEGAPLLPLAAQLEPARIALAILGRLERLGIVDAEVRGAAERVALLLESGGTVTTAPALRRAPYFCSGCPHSRSTRVPADSLSMTGIGCHTMVGLVRPTEALLPTHMGGEGANWLGLAPFTNTPHMFQNMGDGTYYHSGLLAIRAAVASGANITFKILYNDAVAMTGGQPVDGPISVAEIAAQVLHEGVKGVVLLSDNPDAHRRTPNMPNPVRIGHRDELEAMQLQLRDTPGCTVLIYEQTCAAEKRRRRKRGLYPDPAKRLFIAPSVCEGCGDCSTQSTCVSLLPAPTDMGVKRRIDQASCNKDFSCLNGFCPSFITVLGAGPRKVKPTPLEASLFDHLPEPTPRPLDSNGFAAMITGVGGTGVITVAAILGMAAHLEGRAASLFDMTGLAQKNGAVFSHVRIAPKQEDLRTQRVGRGEADVVFAFDVVAALADEARQTVRKGRTVALVNSDVMPTVAFQFNMNATVDGRVLTAQLGKVVGEEAMQIINAVALASTLLGNPIGANLLLVGFAIQRGLIPVGVVALEQAVRLNGTAVELNLTALRLGRALAADPARVRALLPPEPEPLDPSLDALVARRISHLTAYQGKALAERYRALLARVQRAEQGLGIHSESLSRAVAEHYARVLAYKDEYEVARLLSDPALSRELATTFATGARLRYNLAPPLLAGFNVRGRPRKWSIPHWLLFPVLRLLAHTKGLRGTILDPFGYSRERRDERSLIHHYEALVENALRVLRPDNLSAAAEILSLVSNVRGFGPVKQQARVAYLKSLEGRWQSFAASGAPGPANPGS